MTKSTPRYWDVLVLWPVVYIVIMIAFVMMLAVLTSGPMDTESSMISLALVGMLFFAAHIASMVIILITYIYAIHALYTRTVLSDSEKRNWLILIVLFSVVTVPILHFTRLRK